MKKLFFAFWAIIFAAAIAAIPAKKTTRGQTCICIMYPGDKFFLTETDNDTCTLQARQKLSNYTDINGVYHPISSYAEVWTDQ